MYHRLPELERRGISSASRSRCVFQTRFAKFLQSVTKASLRRTRAIESCNSSSVLPYRFRFFTPRVLSVPRPRARVARPLQPLPRPLTGFAEGGAEGKGLSTKSWKRQAFTYQAKRPPRRPRPRHSRCPPRSLCSRSPSASAPRSRRRSPW